MGTRTPRGAQWSTVYTRATAAGARAQSQQITHAIMHSTGAYNGKSGQRDERGLRKHGSMAHARRGNRGWKRRTGTSRDHAKPAAAHTSNCLSFRGASRRATIFFFATRRATIGIGCFYRARIRGCEPVTSWQQAADKLAGPGIHARSVFSWMGI